MTRKPSKARILGVLLSLVDDYYSLAEITPSPQYTGLSPFSREYKTLLLTLAGAIHLLLQKGYIEVVTESVPRPSLTLDQVKSYVLDPAKRSDMHVMTTNAGERLYMSALRLIQAEEKK